MPIIIPGIFGSPTREGKYERGASSPAIPAFIIPVPLSIIIAGVYSLDIFKNI